MLLAIDIGNTNINTGLFKGGKLVSRSAVSTPKREYSAFLRGVFSKHRIDDIIICSVVPEATSIIQKEIKGILGKPPYILGKKISVPMRNLYRHPSQVGHDRLAGAYAAAQLYGAPLVVVDFGTAITFDVVSRKKEYLGGMILPGLQMSLDALTEKTALLPEVKLAKPKELIGRDTRGSMLNGVIYGFAGMVDDLSVKIKHKLSNRARVIGTGGSIGLIAAFCRELDIIDRDLVLKGLNLVYESNRSKKNT